MYLKMLGTVLISSLTALALVGCGQTVDQQEPEADILARGGTEMLIALAPSTSFPAAKGKARYRDRSGQRDLQIEVENILSLAGRTVSVCVNNAQIGTATVSALGAARLSRETQLGQAVPVVVKGTLVKVTTAANCTGTTIVSGTF